MSSLSEPHIVSTPNEYKLANAPTDCISRVHFAPDDPKMLMVSSWDCFVRIYELAAVGTSSLCRTSWQHQAPILDCCFLDVGSKGASAGLDNAVKLYDFSTSSETNLGSHDKSVRCLSYCAEARLLVSGGWDAAVKIWDTRASRCSSRLLQPERVYSMDSIGYRLLVATAGRKLLIWDLRMPGAPESSRESSLKYQTRSIRAFPNGEAFVVSSIEGRVAVEYLSMDPDVQKRKYAFKCHRNKDEQLGQEFIYPVNAIAFHPIYNTFATGGSDALVNVWDPFNKKRLCQFRKYPSSISSLAFSHDGCTLAIASSYQYETPEIPATLPEDTIHIKTMSDNETKPKT